MCEATSESIVKENDPVILYGGYNMVFFLPNVTRGSIFNCRLGNFYHEDIIESRYGSKVRDRQTKRWCCVLRPTVNLLAKSLPHRTQIIYETDANTLLILLNALPGQTIIDCGTGSGAFTIKLAQAVKPSGIIHSFEFHEERCNKAKEEFSKYGLTHLIKSHFQDVYVDGFHVKDAPKVYADAAFLDLPEPWKALNHVQKHLKPLARLCTFSPCIEQIQKTAEWLHSKNFLEVRVFESLSKQWGTLRIVETLPSSLESSEQSSLNQIKKRKLDSSLSQSNMCPYQFQFPMQSHTSYLLVATVPPFTKEQ